METTSSAVMAFQDLTFEGVRALIRVDFNVPMSKPAEDGSRTVTDDTRIRGCQSEAHVRIGVNDGLVHMVGAADAKLVQGLMGVLSIAIEGLAPAQAALIPVDFAEEMGLLNSLTPSRSNGFRNMYDKVMDEIRASME